MTSTEKTPTGAENITWDLGDLYASPDDPRIATDIAASLALAKELAEKYHGRVASLSAAELAEAMGQAEQLQQMLGRLGSYASLLWTTDTQNPEIGKLRARIQEHYVEINQLTLFFELEWVKAPDSVMAHLKAPELRRYRHYLTTARSYRDHTLSEPEEKVLTQASLTGMSAWGRFFDELMSGLKYDYEGREVTQSEILTLIKDPDREVRRQAADSVTQTLAKQTHATTYIYNMMLLERQTQDKMRGYPSWVSYRNLSNQVSDETVEALVNAVTSRYDVVNRYYKLLAKRLGLDKLYDYDRYAPVELSKKEVHWSEAQGMVLEAFGKFSPRMQSIAGEFFEKRWIDARIKPGKRGGAFCSPSTTDLHPYVFLNYDGTLDTVMTLAHELGHGLHFYLARPRGEFESGTPLTTAEMASTFCEMVVFDDLIARETDPHIRFSMRMDKVADSFATIYRQISMNRFEHATHTARRGGGELSTAQISDLWMQTQQAMFGDSLHLREEYSTWWSYIPHFLHTPGYVYAYAFGELLVWALYARYQAEPAGFADNYLDVLAAGGSDYPHRILAPLGVDLQDPHFWNEGVGLLDAFLKQTEADAQALA
jgi:oligoendopeptidase F